jgi:hypothetical protein
MNPDQPAKISGEWSESKVECIGFGPDSLSSTICRKRHWLSGLMVDAKYRKKSIFAAPYSLGWLWLGGLWLWCACHSWAGAGSHRMVQTELYFGLMGPQGELIADSSFTRFVQQEVTPVFPQGYTIMPAQGQWQMDDSQIVQEPSRVILILHAREPALSARLDSIADRYCRAFGQEAVMRISRPVRASFPDG